METYKNLDNETLLKAFHKAKFNPLNKSEYDYLYSEILKRMNPQEKQPDIKSLADE